MATVAAGLALFAPHSAGAQAQGPPSTRAEQIEQARREKDARLSPERSWPFAERIDDLVARGVLGSLAPDGPHAVLGGMRSGQGFSIGGGYKRSDLGNDRFGFRATLRGSPQLAWMGDLQLFVPRIYNERGSLDLYAKYEHSPQMDYYGAGPDTIEADRSSFRLDDLALEVRGGWSFYRFLRVGGIAGAYRASTGKGERSGVPSLEEAFEPEEAPGLGIDGRFLRAGIFAELDFRDLPRWPRAGGYYELEWTRYWDTSDAERFDFRRFDVTLEHYFPYWNKSRVVAVRLRGAYTWTAPNQEVPFYLQPTLGGNDDLRGFERYRFHADNAFVATVEHRWHSFAAMDVALFVDAGKVADRAALLYRERLRADVGLGLRFKVRDAFLMRIDQALSNEGYRFIWTFGDNF